MRISDWSTDVCSSDLRNKDGAFQRTARFRGPDLDSATPAELVAVTARLNSTLRRLGSGWAVFVEAQRVPALSYPVSDFPDAVSELVDVERREQFREEGAHFERFYYLTQSEERRVGKERVSTCRSRWSH